MTEIEVPTEHLHEHLHHHAHNSGQRWIMLVALTAALLAVFAAITALFAGHFANEAMIDQIQSSDKWAFYQAKGIKSSILESRVELIKELGKTPNPKDIEKIEKYKEEQKEIEKEAREKEVGSKQYLKTHNTLSRGVTIFQIAIAICAIAALTQRKWLWFSSIFLGAWGVIFLMIAFL